MVRLTPLKRLHLHLSTVPHQFTNNALLLITKVEEVLLLVINVRQVSQYLQLLIVNPGILILKIQLNIHKCLLLPLLPF